MSQSAAAAVLNTTAEHPRGASAEPGRSIPDRVIASVKQHVSTLSMLKRYGIVAKKVGSGYKAICPFHKVDGHAERTASLSIDPIKNTYHCFSCGEGGDVIKLVMKIDGLDFVRAIEKLLALTPVPVSSKVEPEAPAAAKQEPPAKPALTEEQRQTILREVVRRSIDDLRNSEAGRKYLEGRGLDPLPLLQSYTFGFCNGHAYDKLDASDKQKLQALGLLNGSHAFFENCVIFPLSKDGRLTTIYARKTTAVSTEPNGGRHYLLPGKREGLFLPTAGLNPQKPVIITESIIDGLSLFIAGITNVLPLLGVNGFLSDHLEYLKRQSFPKIFIALNGDEAGNRAAAKLKQNLANEKLPAEILTLPDGKDINEMLQEVGAGKLHEWFSERIGVKDEAKPTVWEDDTGNLFVLIDDREYRVRGLSSGGMDRLKVNLKVAIVNNKQLGYYDTLDLYLSRSREHFILQSAKALQKERDEIAGDINRLITILEEMRLVMQNNSSKSPAYKMSPEEQEEAMAWLKSPNLLERIEDAFAQCGMVGNKNNCLIAFLVSLSRLLDKALGALTISRSGAGKSFLQEIIAMFTPDEWLSRITRLTGQSLFYKGKTGIKNKTLIIEEDEGMKDAMFAVRVLLSSQRLHLQSIKHDQSSGELKDFENVVEGPASILIATTDKAAFDHETANRFFSLYLDESPEQTKKILEFQDRLDSVEGLDIKAKQKQIAKLMKNIQRLLTPIMVVNPIGTGVKYPPEILHSRREKTKIQTLIKVTALLHQHQREIKEKEVLGAKIKYIEVTQADVDAVKRIAGDILRHSLDDISKLSREMLNVIHAIIEEKYEAALKEDPLSHRDNVIFTRKEIKDRTRWSMWHIIEYLRELENEGYICSRMGKQGQKYAYMLVDSTIPELPQIE